jgi:hypothetical protein
MASARHSCCHRRNRSIASHGLFASWLMLLAYPGPHAAAADFCVSSPSGLQIALEAAAGNGVDDHIRMVAGSYLPTQGLDFASQQSHALHLSGGYTNGCASLSTAPTTISGQNIPAGAPDILLSFLSPGAVVVEGLRLMVSGRSALSIDSTSGDITIDRIRVDSSSCGLFGCIRADSVSGTIRFRGNLIVANTSLVSAAVSLGTDSSHIFVSSNTIYDNLTIPFMSTEPGAAGLFVEAGRLDASRFTVLSNNILHHNTGNGYFDLKSRGFSFRLNNLLGTASGDPASSISAESNADPNLCLALPCTEFYTPQTGSPAVDSGMDSPIGGSPAMDIYLNPRWRGLHPDRGAVEGVGNLLSDGFE